MKKRYDLEERTLIYASNINRYVNNLPKSISNLENGKQLVRAAGSVGANYIEANENLGPKDFIMRLRISKKEAKEARFWLYLTNPKTIHEEVKRELIQESTELMNILGAIIRKFT